MPAASFVAPPNSRAASREPAIEGIRLNFARSNEDFIRINPRPESSQYPVTPPSLPKNVPIPTCTAIASNHCSKTNIHPSPKKHNPQSHQQVAPSPINAAPPSPINAAPPAPSTRQSPVVTSIPRVGRDVSASRNTHSHESSPCRRQFSSRFPPPPTPRRFPAESDEHPTSIQAYSAFDPRQTGI